MKIVALDTHVTDFDGLSFDKFSELGEFIKYDFTSSENRISRIADATAVITNKVLIDEQILNLCPTIQYIGVTATGINNVSLAAASNKEIAVTNVPGYSTNSVAQLVISFILKHYSRVEENSSLELISEYQKSFYFSLQHTPTREVAGKTLAIIGYGEIGQRVSEIARALGIKVIKTAIPGRTYKETRVSLEDAFSQADIVSLHCPLTEETKEIIDKSSLGKLKSSAILINTARGGLINEQDLANSLKSESLSHAYLDVLSVEPPKKENPLLNCPNTTITPHLAWATRESRERLINEAFQNLLFWQQGKSRNRVD